MAKRARVGEERVVMTIGSSRMHDWAEGDTFITTTDDVGFYRLNGTHSLPDSSVIVLRYCGPVRRELGTKWVWEVIRGGE